MANRDLNTSPTVTTAVPHDPNTGAPVNFFADLGDQVAEVSAQSKALQATAATSAAFRQLDTQFRLQNADNPNDPNAIQNYRDSRAAIVTQMAQNVPAIAQRDYFSKTVDLGQASDTSNQLWTTKQLLKNAANNLQTGTQNYYDQANQAGKDFAANGGDIGQALNYSQANQALGQFATPVLGADKTGAYLKDFNANYVKSFVAGVAETNPVQAAQLLQNPAISQHFTTQDVGDMAQVIQKTQRQQALIGSLQVTKNDSAVIDIVNDNNLDYYQKRVKLDELSLGGAISPGAAQKGMRVINSVNDMESQTDTPQMASVINKVYDLNSQAQTSPDDYLMGVRNIQQQVLDLQANNQLTAQDATKLNRTITNLTQAKLASATNSAGDEFYNANQAFTALPPEYRGQATRALFYASHGQNMSDAELSTQANNIIDQINKQRRVSAVVTVDQLQQPDPQFLKTLGVSQDQINYTAKKYGITPEAVMMQLRANQAAKNRMNTTSPLNRNIIPDPEDQGQGGDIGTKQIAPPVGIQLPGSAEDEQ